MQKDASTVPAERDGKRQHGVEVLNTVDEGTSVPFWAQGGADFHAETTLAAVAELFVRHGLPEVVRMDRDVRGCRAVHPAATFRRPWCASRSRLGVGVLLCDPHSPQQNGFVERYHRTFQQECLAVPRPLTLQELREATTQFVQHDNYERPLKAAQLWQPPATGGLPDLA